MSFTDRAFIRAYGQEAAGQEQGTAADDVQFHPAQADECPDVNEAIFMVDGAEMTPPAPHVTWGDQLPVSELPAYGAGLNELPLGVWDQPTQESQESRETTITNGSGVTEPLSAFMPVQQPVHQLDDAFKPALGVQRFVWPSVCDRLQAKISDQLDEVAWKLKRTATDGCLVVGFAGSRDGAGCTTTLLCVARQLAVSDEPVVLVDANFHRPALARQLGLAIECGWEDVLCDKLPFAETLIVSEEDRLTLVPLRDQVRDPKVLVEGMPLSISIGMLRQHFRLVLLDMGQVFDEPSGGVALSLAARSYVDAVVLTHDIRNCSTLDLQNAVGQFSERGVATIGIAETFTRS